MSKEKIIVALDVDTLDRALELVEQLQPYVGMFKVGMELYNAVGPRAISAIRERGGEVFVDLKLHDIPTTVAKAVRVLTRNGAAIINVHASGGVAMMQAAASAVQDEAAVQGITPPQLIAVTVLTSMDQETLNCQLQIPGPVEQNVVHWAELAQQAGLHGVVASPREITAIRKACGEEFVIITPGIRPLGTAKNDQERITTPEEAVQLGATYLVIGRPITQAANPVEAVQNIIAGLDKTKGAQQQC